MHKVLVVLFALCYFSSGALAQTAALFGNEQQPGNRLHQDIEAMITAGMDASDAIANGIDASISEQATVLSPDAKSAVAFNLALSNSFYQEMLDSNSLIDVTKVLIEENPSLAVEVITLGIVLYPEFAQEVLDGAVLTGVISPDDALVAALQAGADPTLVTLATAAGADAPSPIAPIGGGIGGGGAGGGDTTASTN